MANNKKRPTKDPAAEREAQRYERPIPSRELILKALNRAGEPMDFDEVAAYLELIDENDREALRRRLNAMVRDGQLLLNRRHGYVPVDSNNLVRGRVIAHADGFGFLVPDAGGTDVFLSPREMRPVLHGDRIVAQVTGIDRRGRREGSIAEILQRANTRVVGHLAIESGVVLLVPDNSRITQDILIPPEHVGDAASGQIAVAEIIEQPTPRRQPIGRIVEVLGERRELGMETDIAINSHGIPAEWPEAVEEETAELPDEVPERDKKRRKDLRSLPLVTIDAEDSKDFDDAVYCERRGNDWRLIVAIADVSAYVSPESALDAEAGRRGTSVYFPGRVVSMLPEKLSNGLCSLNPDVDRLCLACDMRINEHGEIRRTRFHEAVMRSHGRLTYTEVGQILLERSQRAREQRSALVPHLENLHGLFEVLHRARKRRGAIDFDTTETEIQFGDDGRIANIAPVERTDAHRLIEECMIAANVATARYLRKQRLPALYRVHKGPETDRVEDLRSFLAERGLKLGGGDEPQPDHFSSVLRQAQDRPDAYLIQTVLLRSMQRAVYQPDCSGHFGLALDEYAHFTSPIRRYPDLLVHRAIRHKLQGGKPRGYRYEHEDMVHFGDHCSMTERRADEATRDVEGVLKCEYMEDRVGETFDGLITGVTSFGLFVCLDATFAEGLAHVTTLPRDYYNFDPVGHCLTGERSGRVYRLGDPLQVRVTRVNVDDRKIDFEPVSESVAGGPGKGGRSNKGGGGDKRGGKKAAAKKKSGSRDKGARRKKTAGSG
jgi:ribonuclease R